MQLGTHGVVGSYTLVLLISEHSRQLQKARNIAELVSVHRDAHRLQLAADTWHHPRMNSVHDITQLLTTTKSTIETYVYGFLLHSKNPK